MCEDMESIKLVLEITWKQICDIKQISDLY